VAAIRFPDPNEEPGNPYGYHFPTPSDIPSFPFATALNNISLLRSSEAEKLFLVMEQRRNVEKNASVTAHLDDHEPLRPIVDRSVLEFALSHTFTPGDFTITSKGGCRLNPQMAKVVASQVAILPADPVVKDFLASVGAKSQKSDLDVNPSS